LKEQDVVDEIKTLEAAYDGKYVRVAAFCPETNSLTWPPSDLKAANGELEVALSGAHEEKLAILDRVQYLEQTIKQTQQKENETLQSIQEKIKLVDNAELERDKATILEQQAKKEIEKLQERLMMASERYKQSLTAETERLVKIHIYVYIYCSARQQPLKWEILDGKHRFLLKKQHCLIRSIR
jgi:hypothetical protein